MRWRSGNPFGTKHAEFMGPWVFILLTALLCPGLTFAQTLPQNTTGKNPGTQVLPGEPVTTGSSAASQTTPQKRVQMGVGGVSADSFKFGEYNGLESSGPFGVGNFDLSGGSRYTSEDTWRWRMTGSNLGLADRYATAEFGKQGRYQVWLAFDELLANRSGTYQTPYLGVGTNSLTLPSNWIKPIQPQNSASALNLRSLSSTTGTGSVYNSSGVLTAPTATQLATLANIVATDVPDFYTVPLFTRRLRGDVGMVYTPNVHLEIPVRFSRENKGGLKSVGVVTSQISSDAIIMPYVVNWNTTQASGALIYKKKKLFVSGGYYGSFFQNETDGMTWQDVSAPTTSSATYGEEPSNEFNQGNVMIAYKFRDTAKLVAAVSYGRNTQNQPYLPVSDFQNGALPFGVPVNSLGGIVVNTMAYARFTAERGKKLEFIATYKFSDHDNQTPVHIYLFQDVDETKSSTASTFSGVSGLPTGIGTNTNIYNNRAYSSKTQLASAEAEYKLSKSQYVDGEFSWSRIDRNCTNSWISCADAPTVNESTMRGEWVKNKGAFTAMAEYSFAIRRGTYNENAFLSLVPAAGYVPTNGASTSLLGYLTANNLTAFGPVAGLPATPLTGDAAIYNANNNAVPNALYGSNNTINEIPGLRRFMSANRNRNRARAEFTWQGSDKFTLQGTGQGVDDHYVDTVYGLKRTSLYAVTMDANYSFTPDWTSDLFYTYDNYRYATAGDAYGSNSTTAFQGQAANTVVSGGCFATIAAKNASAKIDPCLVWGKNNRDKIDTLGFTLRRENLLNKRMTMGAELLYTRARTSMAATGGSYVNNPLALAAPAPALPAGTPAVYYISAAAYPLLRNDEISIRPNVNYAISTALSLQGYYWYQRLMNSDWAYQGLQFGTGTSYLPTNEQSPGYSVQVAGASLTYNF